MTTLATGAIFIFECKACGIGTYENGVCIPCPIGQYQSNTQSTSCIPCASGYTTTTQGCTSVSACVACQKGYYGLADNTCEKCPMQTYQNTVGQTTCKNCPSNYYTTSIGGTDLSSCIPCSAGYYGIGNACFICQIGYYQPSTAQSSCITCPVGKTTSSQGSTALSNCIDCPKGTFYETIGKCTKCSPGEYQGSTGQTACLKCNIGQYQPNENSFSCLDCGAGYITLSLGSTSFNDCIKCNPGTYESAHTCVQCGIGFYQTLYGMTTCQLCADGYTTIALGASLLTDCIQCSGGKYGLGGKCFDCSIGQYQDTLGSISCKQCDSGKTTLTTGVTFNTDCQLCPEGSYEQGNICLQCAIGYYQDIKGSTSCILCPITTSTNNQFGTVSLDGCLPCPVGTYSMPPQCVSCNIGYFQDEIGQTSCKQCPVGTSTTILGCADSSICCTLCPIGTYSIVPLCVPCPLGRYKPSYYL